MIKRQINEVFEHCFSIYMVISTKNLHGKSTSCMNCINSLIDKTKSEFIYCKLPYCGENKMLIFGLCRNIFFKMITHDSFKIKRSVSI